MGAVEEALGQWREMLRPDQLGLDEALLDRYARSTHPEATRPAAVLYPESREAVQAIVRIAARCACPLYPISRGRNFGYGDACAPEPGAVIIDLSRMNRIHEINAELGYAVIEPGVTQEALYTAIQAAAPGFWMDSTGAGREASVLGNVLERGFGHTPYGDHVQSCCGLEVILADGRLLRTGFGHYPNARARHTFPYGLGPMLDGLFSQSNLGIVTRMGLWLYPAPDDFRMFFIKVPRDEHLAPLVDALRPLRLRGLLNSAVHIGNDLRIISSLETYPWEAAGGATPLPEALRATLRKKNGIGAWNVSGALTGSTAQVRASARAVRRAVGMLGKVVFVTDRKLALGLGVLPLLEKLGWAPVLQKQLRALAPNYFLLKGKPTDEPLAGVQWRLRSPDPTLDPLESGCGLLWMSPVLPIRGEDARRLIELVEPEVTAHGFELLATFTLLNARSMVGILNVSFDKEVAEESAAALACYDAVMNRLKGAGYPPYRLAPQGMGRWVDTEDPFWQTARAIKETLDPQGILARGRYIL